MKKVLLKNVNRFFFFFYNLERFKKRLCEPINRKRIILKPHGRGCKTLITTMRINVSLKKVFPHTTIKSTSHSCSSFSSSDWSADRFFFLKFTRSPDTTISLFYRYHNNNNNNLVVIIALIPTGLPQRCALPRSSALFQLFHIFFFSLFFPPSSSSWCLLI